MTQALVVGLASLDRIHLPGRAPLDVAGGAGLYTALALAVSGVRVTLFAPRPQPLPEPLAVVAAHFGWVGPTVDVADLPRLEIAHFGGGRAQLLGASWGGEAVLVPEGLPDDLGRYNVVHVAALSTAARQVTFASACRRRGARLLSAGTYGRVAQAETTTVRTLMAGSDVFFMNENEARFIFGEVAPEALALAPGLARRATFVTQAERGAIVLSGGASTHVDAMRVEEVDPTGAGDTFCGAVLAALIAGMTPGDAAAAGVALAARVIAQPGPAYAA